METMELKIVTPQRVVFDDQVQVVIAKGTEGEMGIYPDHTPMVTPLKISVLRVKKDNKMFPIAISGGGFIEITPINVTVLTDSAELPDEIDVDRAQAAKDRAQERINAEKEKIDFNRADLSLKRAMIRLRTVEKE